MNSIAVEPMIIEVPGIPGKLRSQTLDEYMAVLQADHPARKELQNLREMALEGMKAMNEMVALNRRNEELVSQIKAMIAKDVPIPQDPASPFRCDVCGKVTASAWGLNRHKVSKHPNQHD